MPGNVYPIQSTFSRGEGTPYLRGRIDIDHYRMLLAECSNFIVLPYGGLERRPGTRHVVEVKDSSRKTRLIEYQFSVAQGYIIELGHLYARFYSNGGRIENPPGTPVEIVTPWTEDDIFDVDYSSFRDVIYCFHPDYPPQEIVRESETSWSIQEHVTEDGPFLPENTDFDTIRPLGTGDMVPPMTSNTTPSGVASASAFNGVAWEAFSRLTANAWSATVDTGWLAYLNTSPQIAVAYTIQAETTTGRAPTDWVIEADQNDNNWAILHTVSGEPSWAPNETRAYEMNNSTAYLRYRLRFSKTDGSSGVSTIRNLRYKLRPEDSVYETTVDSVSGINGGAGFLASDVGRQIRVQGSDASWRWGYIRARNSATSVDVEWHGNVQTVEDNDVTVGEPTKSWRIGAWSEETGYPARVTLFKNRLYSARTKEEPSTVWASASLAFRDHGVSDPVLATDAFSTAILGEKSGQVQWLANSQRDLLISMDGRQLTQSPADDRDAISATNIDLVDETYYKSSDINVINAGRAVIFADLARRRLREYAPALQTIGYDGPDLTLMSEHLFRSKVVETTYIQDPYPIIYAVAEDGEMVGLTYDPSQQVSGMARNKLGGTFGNYSYAPVMSNASISNADGNDETWLIVKRTINGATVQYVEYIAPRIEFPDPDESTGEPVLLNFEEVKDCEFFDSSLKYDGAATSTISGLDHLIGETVGVLGDGVELGDFVVDGSGEITLNDEVEKATVGLRFKSRGRTLRAPAHGNADGSGLGRRRVVGEIFVDLYNTGSLLIGTPRSTLQETVDRSTSQLLDSVSPLATGMQEKTGINDTYQGDGTVIFETDRGLPCVLRSIQTRLNGEP